MQFEYKIIDEILDEKSFLDEDGGKVFDANSLAQMRLMMARVCEKMDINDAYSIKKLEMMLKYELPFFATNRRLVYNWVIENFNY